MLNEYYNPDNFEEDNSPHPHLTSTVSITHDLLAQVKNMMADHLDIQQSKTYLEKHRELLERYKQFQLRVLNIHTLLSNALLNKSAELKNIDGKGSFHAVFIIDRKEPTHLHTTKKYVIKLPISCATGRFQEIFRPTIEQMIAFMYILEEKNIIVTTTLYDGGATCGGLPLYGLLQEYIPRIEDKLVTRSSLMNDPNSFQQFEEMMMHLEQLTQVTEHPMLLDFMGLDAAAKSISYLVHALRGTLPADSTSTIGDFPWENLVYQDTNGQQEIKLMDTIPFPVDFQRFSNMEKVHAKALMMGYKRYMILVFDILKKERELREQDNLHLLANYTQKRVFPELQRYAADYLELFKVMLGLLPPNQAKVLKDNMRWFSKE